MTEEKKFKDIPEQEVDPFDKDYAIELLVDKKSAHSKNFTDQFKKKFEEKRKKQFENNQQ